MDDLLPDVEESPADLSYETDLLLLWILCFSSKAFLLANRAFSNSATENIFDPVSCEWKRLILLFLAPKI